MDLEKRLSNRQAERQQRRLSLVAALGVLVALAILGGFTFRGATMYLVTIDEALAMDLEERVGQTMRIAGDVVTESIVWNPESMLLRFDVTHNGEVGTVEYVGVMPDNLSHPEAQVILLGSFRADGVFEVTKLLVQCPSKYEAAHDAEY